MTPDGFKTLTRPTVCLFLGLAGCQAIGAGSAAESPRPAEARPVGGETEPRGEAPASVPAHVDPVPNSNASTAMELEAGSSTPQQRPGSPARPVPASTKSTDSFTGNITPTRDLSLPEASPFAEHNARRWQLANELRDSTGWNLFESQRYFIATPIDNPLLIEGAKRRLDAMHERLHRDLPPGLNQGGGEAALLRFLPDRAAYERSGGRQGSTAQWIGTENTLVCFDAGSEQAREQVTWPALQHVLVHEHLTSTLNIETPPSWLLYGVAAYYEGLRFEATPEGGHWNGADSGDQTRALSEAVAAEGPMPLARLLAFTPEEFLGVNEFGSGAYRNLVLARSFVSFCWDEVASPEHRAPARFLEVFTASIAEGQSPAQALELARGSRTLADIETAWKDWIALATGRPLPKGP